MVKTVRSAICGSDVNGVGVAPGNQFGHETCGYVAEVGKDNKDFKEGSRISIVGYNYTPTPVPTSRLLSNEAVLMGSSGRLPRPAFNTGQENRPPVRPSGFTRMRFRLKYQYMD